MIIVVELGVPELGASELAGLGASELDEMAELDTAEVVVMTEDTGLVLSVAELGLGASAELGLALSEGPALEGLGLGFSEGLGISGFEVVPLDGELGGVDTGITLELMVLELKETLASWRSDIGHTVVETATTEVVTPPD